VEQRHGQKVHPLGQLVRIDVGQGLARAQQGARRRDDPAGDAGDEVAVGGHRALGPAGGAGGVEDGDLVVGVELDRGRRLVRQAGPVAGPPDHALQGRQARIARQSRRPRDIDPIQRRAGVQVRQDSRQPLLVEDRDLGPRIAEAELQLLARPPGVQRRGDGPGQHGRIVGHRPFGQVAHDDGHPVALAHPVLGQPARQADGGAGESLEGDAVVVEHQELAVAETAGVVEDVAQGRRDLGPHPDRPAVDDRLADLESAAGAGEPGMGLGDGHHRPFVRDQRLAVRQTASP